MFFDALYKSLLSGGWVLVPIFLCGAGGFYLLLKMAFKLGADLYSSHFDDEINELIEELKNEDLIKLKNLKNQYLNKSGLLHKVLLSLLESRSEKPEAREVLIQQDVIGVYHTMDKGMHMVSVLAASAPLLGLLGTVSGMMSTFQVITIYGNSNPVLMADGISEALITTQSGLLIAFPIVLWKNRLQDRLDWVRKQIELCVTRVLNVEFEEREIKDGTL